jgi:carbon storage regulator
MLILTRRTGEQMDITLEDGRRLTLMILGVIGNQVRVGISAPKTVTIDRHEVTLRKQREAGPHDEHGDVDGNRFEPGPLDEPTPAAAQTPEPQRPPTGTLKLTKPYRPRIDNPDDLNHRRKLEGVR